MLRVGAPIYFRTNNEKDEGQGEDYRESLTLFAEIPQLAQPPFCETGQNSITLSCLSSPVEQSEESLGRGDDLHDNLQDAGWQGGGAASVVAVPAPAALDARHQRVGNGAQLLRQTA